MLENMKLTFILFAFTFDLYKWCVFIAATGTVQNKKLLEARTKTLTIALVVIQISIFLLIYSLKLIYILSIISSIYYINTSVFVFVGDWIVLGIVSKGYGE